MKTRTKIELLELLKSRMISCEVPENNGKMMLGGMCTISIESYYLGLINKEEECILLELICQNKPLGIRDEAYYFEPSLIAPRIEWCNKLIKEIKNQNKKNNYVLVNDN